MSLNQAFAHSKKHSELSIDFEVNENFTSTDFKSNSKKYCGTLNIGSKKFEMTLNDINILSDLLINVKEVFHRKHSIGLMK